MTKTAQNQNGPSECRKRPVWQVQNGPYWAVLVIQNGPREDQNGPHRGPNRPRCKEKWPKRPESKM